MYTHRGLGTEMGQGSGLGEGKRNGDSGVEGSIESLEPDYRPISDIPWFWKLSRSVKTRVRDRVKKRKQMLWYRKMGGTPGKGLQTQAVI